MSDLEVSCPTCKKTVLWNEKSLFRPFCSKRCQMIDLGEWASESHKIAGSELTEEEAEELINSIDFSEQPLFSLASENNKFTE